MSTAPGTFEVINPHSATSMMELISAYGDARAAMEIGGGAGNLEACRHTQRLYESLVGYLLEICPQQ